MRATVCELPYQPHLLEAAWVALCAHTHSAQSELVLLPEFAFVEPVWESLPADPARWGAAVALSDAWAARLPAGGGRGRGGGRAPGHCGRAAPERGLSLVRADRLRAPAAQVPPAR